MTGLFLMYALITGIFAVLMTVYVCVICAIYRGYRKCGLTRKQAILTTWRIYGE